MFFKRLLGNDNSNNESASSPQPVPGSPNLPAGVQRMNADMQKKLQSRVQQYNMKVVIRGDRNVGKTSLFRRIQGQNFTEDYLSTEEIQVAHIPWNYKLSDDVVKVEVWDVVDKGKPRKKMDGLKVNNEVHQLYSNASLDAEFIDVYKGAHCVIFMFDITKLWTFDYIEREIGKVPTNLPILILANRSDQSHHRTVPKDKARVFAETVMADRPPGGPPIMAADTSMKNNFGLKFVHSFLGIPFLVMQRYTLAVLLEQNAIELETMCDELGAMLEDPSQSYDVYSEALANRRRQQADSLSPAVALAAKGAIAPTPPPMPDPQPQEPTAQAIVEHLVPDKLKGVLGVQSNQPAAPPTPKEPTQVAMTGVGRGQPIIAPGAPVPPIAASKKSPSPEVFQPGVSAAERSSSKSPGATMPGQIGCVDDFVPDSGNFDNFLDDEPSSQPAQPQQQKKSGFFGSIFGSKKESPQPKPSPPPPPQVPYTPPAPPAAKPRVIDSDEDDDGRPQIAGFSEDIDIDEEFAPAVYEPGHITSDESSDEEDDPVDKFQPMDDIETYIYQEEDIVEVAKPIVNEPEGFDHSEDPPTPPPIESHARTESIYSYQIPGLDDVRSRSVSNVSQDPVPPIPDIGEGTFGHPALIPEETNRQFEQKDEKAEIWEEEETVEIQPQPVSVEPSRQEQQETTIQLSDMDFAFLEEHSSKLSPNLKGDDISEASSTVPVVKGKKKSANAKKSPGKKTKKATAAATEEAVHKGPAKKKVGRKSKTVKKESSGDEEPPVVSQKKVSQPAQLKVSPKAAPPPSSLVVEDEDDLENFLNS